MLAAAPGNPDSYEFFAQLCFGLGGRRRGWTRYGGRCGWTRTTPRLPLTLASTLAEQYRTDEAIELYWRAFERSDDLDGKIGIVSRLTELYLQRNQLDRLFTAVAAPGA